jgi:hypothetical protein
VKTLTTTSRFVALHKIGNKQLCDSYHSEYFELGVMGRTQREDRLQKYKHIDGFSGNAAGWEDGGKTGVVGRFASSSFIDKYSQSK